MGKGFKGEVGSVGGGWDVVWNARALRFFALAIVLGVAELDVRAEPSGFHGDFQIRRRILAEHAIGAGFAVGGQRPGVTAFRIVGAADERAELAGFQIELAGAASRALAGSFPRLARRLKLPDPPVPHATQ